MIPKYILLPASTVAKMKILKEKKGLSYNTITRLALDKFLQSEDFKELTYTEHNEEK